MKNKKNSTTVEIAELVIKAIIAIAALVTAFKWW